MINYNRERTYSWKVKIYPTFYHRNVLFMVAIKKYVSFGIFILNFIFHNELSSPSMSGETEGNWDNIST